jgi:Leucine-rich repeat (LRR) protein
MIRSLEGLKPLGALTELSLARNQLVSLDGLSKLCPHLEILVRLKKVDLKGLFEANYLHNRLAISG